MSHHIGYFRAAENHGDLIAFIDPTAKLGRGVTVWHFARILARVVLGDDVSIGSGAEIGRGSSIAGRTRIGAGVFLPPDSVVGQRVFIGPNCTFTDDRHPRVPEVAHATYCAQPPCIGDDAAIGAGCVILPGVTIGRGARVGAGSVVTKDVPAGAMVRGVPARIVERSADALTW